jgi:hypothetical protein
MDEGSRVTRHLPPCDDGSPASLPALRSYVTLAVNTEGQHDRNGERGHTSAEQTQVDPQLSIKPARQQDSIPIFDGRSLVDQFHSEDDFRGRDGEQDRRYDQRPPRHGSPDDKTFRSSPFVLLRNGPRKDIRGARRDVLEGRGPAGARLLGGAGLPVGDLRPWFGAVLLRTACGLDVHYVAELGVAVGHWAHARPSPHQTPTV